MEHRQFLNELFGNKPKDAWINIWQTPLKRSKFFNDVNAAADFVQKLKDKKIDIYVNCGLLGSNLGPRRRGSKEDIIGLPGFYMDIDFKSQSKPNYPPGVASALSLVKNKGYDPTLIVHSGNGIHAWWLFKEPWMFDNPAEGDAAELLNQRLAATVREAASKKGWQIDSVFDRTRVLRIPGTLNCKNPQNIIGVKFLENGGIRYGDPETLDQFLIPADRVKVSANVTSLEKKQIAANLVLDPAADPPADMLEQLLEIDEKFKASWAGNRTDMKKKSSASEHAMSLASIAAQAGWEDQEIADLIVSFYRRNKHDLNKAMRPDFISGTIAKARKTLDDKIIDEYFKEVVPAQNTIYEKDVDPTGERARVATNKMLGIEIIKIVQFEGEKKSIYQVILKRFPEGIFFDGIKELGKYDRFRDKIFEKTRVYIKTKQKLWGAVVDNLGKFMVVKTMDLSTPQQRMKEWIEVYLEDKDPDISIDESAIDNEPFVKDDHWYIYAMKFRNWAFQNRAYLDGFDDMKIEFSIINAKTRRFDAKHPSIPNKRKKCEPYEIPHDIAKPSPKPKLVVDNKESKTNAKNIDIHKSDKSDPKLQDKRAAGDGK